MRSAAGGRLAVAAALTFAAVTAAGCGSDTVDTSDDGAVDSDSVETAG